MISIAVCTHFRVDQLNVLLPQLTSLCDECHVLQEVLIINNGGDRATTNLIEQVKSEKIREVQEPKPGLSNARNRALAEFKADNIWFLDDDTSISSRSSLDAYVQALTTFPSAGYFGGPLEVVWPDGKPTWLGDDHLPLLDGLFGHYNLGSDDQFLDASSLGPYGANFLLRRNLVEQVGRFDPTLGVCAGSIARGEETDYFRRAREKGFSGFYVAAAVVGHRFQVDRLNLRYLWRYGLAKGREHVAAHQEHHFSWLRVVAHQFLGGCWQLLKGRRDRFYQCWINMGAAYGRHSSRTKV